MEGVPIGAAWSVSGPLDDDAFGHLQRAVSGAIRIGYERTGAQDVGYGLRQLTDVANKALSPGINDPTTAVHALGHISAILCQLASRDLRAVVLRDDDDRVRVVLTRPSFAEVVDVAITQPRRYGSSDPQVLERLFRLLEELAWHVDDQSPIREQLQRPAQHRDSGPDFDDVAFAALERAADRVEHAMAHDVGPSIP